MGTRRVPSRLSVFFLEDSIAQCLALLSLYGLVKLIQQEIDACTCF